MYFFCIYLVSQILELNQGIKWSFPPSLTRFSLSVQWLRDGRVCNGKMHEECRLKITPYTKEEGEWGSSEEGTRAGLGISRWGILGSGGQRVKDWSCRHSCDLGTAWRKLLGKEVFQFAWNGLERQGAFLCSFLGNCPLVPCVSEQHGQWLPHWSCLLFPNRK